MAKVTYKTSQRCFIGGAVRMEGETFTCEKIKLRKGGKMPEWLTEVKLTAAQKKAAEEAKAKADKEAEEAEAEQAEVNGPKPSFLDAEKQGEVETL